MVRQGHLLGYIVFGRTADAGGIIRAKDRLSNAIQRLGRYDGTFGVDQENKRIEVRGTFDSSIIIQNLKSIDPKLSPSFEPVITNLSQSRNVPNNSSNQNYAQVVEEKKRLEVMYAGVLRQKDDLEKERVVLRENLGELEKRIKSLTGEDGILKSVEAKYGEDASNLFKAVLILQTPLAENEAYQSLKPQYDKALRAKKETESDPFLTVSPRALEIITQMDSIAREYNDAVVLVSSYLSEISKPIEVSSRIGKSGRKKGKDSIASKVMLYSSGRTADQLFHLIHPDADQFDADEKRSKKQQLYTAISKLKSDGKLIARPNPDGGYAVYDSVEG
jgi:hypothetical protein